MKKTIAYTFLTICGVLIIGACSSSEDVSSTSSTSLPDYETTTLSGTVVNTSWTFKTGRVVVPSTSGGYYMVSMTNEELSNACSSSYTGTSSNPTINFSRDNDSGNLEVGETELCFKSGCTNTVTFYDGSVNYITATGKIKIDTHTTTAVTGKMYTEMGSHTKVNGTFTLSRCCLSGSSYALCSE
tara:strand:+ start:374 stop:928 length:555 start_codon:yes stop_codon:yes gene_type:complete